MLDRMKFIARMMSILALLFVVIGAVNALRIRHRMEPVYLLLMFFIMGTSLVRMLLETQARYPDGLIPLIILLAVSGMRSELSSPHMAKK